MFLRMFTSMVTGWFSVSVGGGFERLSNTEFAMGKTISVSRTLGKRFVSPSQTPAPYPLQADVIHN